MYRTHNDGPLAVGISITAANAATGIFALVLEALGPTVIGFIFWIIVGALYIVVGIVCGLIGLALGVILAPLAYALILVIENIGPILWGLKQAFYALLMFGGVLIAAGVASLVIPSLL